jgi:4-amino-4-deoxy-L-arabinose transferase-like glycosyltransferase
MATIALVLEGIARVPATPLAGCLRAGLGCALAMLAGGLEGLLLTVPMFAVVVMVSPECRNPRASSGLLVGLVLALALGGLWPLLIHLTAPELFTVWAREQWHQLTTHSLEPGKALNLIKLIGWFLWPLWPIALWALWRNRSRLTRLCWLLPLAATVVAIVMIVISADDSPPAALQTIPPMALLAAGGISTLRRGAANAFDWFAAMTFGIFAILVWIAWTAQVFAWPPGLARHIAHVAPGFTLSDAITPALWGGFICLLWFALVWRLPRAPGRSAANWAMGMTMLWCLAVTLLMPWFEHGRTYRPMTNALARALAPYPGECVASMKMPDAVLGMLDYYLALRPAVTGGQNTPCRLLLIYADHKNADPAPLSGWEPTWVFRRGGGTQYEALHLFIRSDRD